MDENRNEKVLEEVETNELGTLRTEEEKPKKKKTSLIAPIISVILGALAWISTFITDEINNFKGLIQVVSGNQEAVKSTTELGKSSSNFLGEIFTNYGFAILFALLLIIFTIIGIVGLCKLITRICRRTKNKFTKD